MFANHLMHSKQQVVGIVEVVIAVVATFAPLLLQY